MTAALLVLMAVVMFGPAGNWLERASWVEQAPRAAIVLWQAIGINGALAAVGAGLDLAVAPLHRGLLGGLATLVSGSNSRGLVVNGFDEACGLTLAVIVVAVLASGITITAARTTVARHHHRVLLDLVGTARADLPGALVLRDQRAAAYCLPGVRPRIVVSEGALGVLVPQELHAVVDHERGHVHERHDLVMLQFSSMVELLSWMPYVARAPRAVGDLLEMAADDYSARFHERRVIASALVQMASTGIVPRCAFASTGGQLTRRVNRLTAAPAKAPVAAALATAAALILVVVPVLVTVAG